ncbi:hypothetical protein Rsub_00143 [Raphidocelis subcapitata]|uniref:Cation/H+ exchanger transmembrane domain-containing protein n=1 Tax=Raphidocelis subcapitata TaxID=307507 RepID=A0A2V0NM26_9CHLO|nr:hypothetical protein Rsub_00143 [Raphidocelis subcapitata]|eukprot:GBF87432.1 hypothetical protein Rsub_00143 [Raphidocelis subcapitata]
MAAAPGHGDGGGVPPTDAVLFLVTCLFVGLATQHFARPLLRHVPYTAVLLAIGLCIGLLQAIPPATLNFTETLHLWMHMEPHLLLMIFLPTIGFSAGIGQEPHLLRKNWGQILILAWPGVAISFVIIALCGRYFFPYGWTWPQSLLFGAMLSATDPVAVVAVLHEVGADAKLASVIDGESLVNDGSALVIFLVLQQIVQGASLGAGQIVVLFCRLALLGAAVGVAFGAATSWWLSRLTREPTHQIILTFTAAYSCYYVAEELLGASGLLAVVCCGFTASLIGGRQITSHVAVQMQAFWSALEWVANTILFLAVGMALAFVLLPPAHPLLQFEAKVAKHVTPIDAGYCVVLYLWMLVARAASIGAFLPLLSTGRVGYAMTLRTAAVMVWAGLRGAVGVAMSLFVLFDPLIESEEFKAHCVFYMAAMAFLTVVVNGSTTKALLGALGMLRRTPAELQVLEHVVADLEAIQSDAIARSPRDPVLGDPTPSAVRAWTRLDAAAGALQAARRRAAPPRRSGAFMRRAVDVEAAAPAGAPVGAGIDIEREASLIAEYRKRLLCAIKAYIGDEFCCFKLDTSEALELQEVASTALDRAEAGPLATWELLHARLAPAWPIERAAALLSRLPLLAPAARALERPAACRRLLLASALARAHRAANKLGREYLGQVATASRDGGDDDAISDSAADPEVQQAAAIVLAESAACADAAAAYARESLLPGHARGAALLRSRLAALQILQEQGAFVGRLQDAGLIAGEEAHTIREQLSDHLEALLATPKWRGPPKERERRRGAAKGGGDGVGAADAAGGAPAGRRVASAPSGMARTGTFTEPLRMGARPRAD